MNISNRIRKTLIGVSFASYTYSILQWSVSRYHPESISAIFKADLIGFIFISLYMITHNKKPLQ